jgi:anti-sigma B factor antagonist
LAVPQVELLGDPMAIMEFEAGRELLADGTCVVCVAGELDLHTAPEFERALLAGAGERAETFILDLSGCTFLDSTALGILVEANRRLGNGNGAVKIVAAAPAIRRPFEITGLDRLFDFYPTRMAALNAS